MAPVPPKLAINFTLIQNMKVVKRRRSNFE